MKSFLLTLVVLFIAFNSKAQAMPDVLGVWCSGKKDCKVQLYKNGNTIEGKVVWLLEDKDYFENGIAYVKGHEFCGKFKLNKDGTLDVTGFICSLKFLKKTDTWTRVME